VGGVDESGGGIAGERGGCGFVEVGLSGGED